MLDDITHRKSHNNLHITCKSFSHAQANSVIHLLNTYHADCNRIFIDVTAITEPEPSVVQRFKRDLKAIPLVPEQVFFKGSTGFRIANDGNRVIVQKAKKEGHVCCGRCAHCHCKEH